MKKISKQTLAYVAGLFDGEGCVNFTRAGQTPTWALRVMVRNCDKEIIEWLQSLFGGRIETKERHVNNPTWKASYCWRADWDTAVNFLVAIDPWVRIKSDQILVARLWNAIRIRSTRPARTQPPDYKILIDLLVRQLSWLNRKGVRQSDDLEPMDEVLKTLGAPLDEVLAELGDAIN